MHLETILSYLCAEESGIPILDLNAGVIRIDYDVAGSLDEKRVNKIIMLSNARREIIPIMPTSRVLVKFEDGEIKSFRFKDQFQAQEQWSFFNQLITSGGIAINAFNEYGQKRDEIWDILGTERLYTPQIRKFYSDLHQSMAGNILKELKQNTALKEKAERFGVQLISIGCGNGADLVCVYKALLSARIATECVGVDISAKEIQQAKKSSPKNFQFIQHSIEALETLPSTLAINPERVVIIISSGSLTREIMQGAYDVIKALHAMQCHLRPDLICIGGYTHTILTPEMAYNAGFSVQITFDEQVHRNIFMLSQQTPEQQRLYVIEKNRGSSLALTALDMSMCFSPLNICKMLTSDEKEQIIELDLSWSHIQSDEITKLSDFIQELPRLINIIISCSEPWSNEFIRCIKRLNKYTLLQRKDCTDVDELPQVSATMARAINRGKELPCSELFTPVGKNTAQLASNGFFAAVATGVKEALGAQQDEAAQQLPHV